MRELFLLLLLTPPALATDPTWSPDPEANLTWEARGTMLRVGGTHLLHVDSGAWHRLDGAWRWSGDVSPDGTRVVRAEVTPDRAPGVEVRDLKSGKTERFDISTPTPDLADVAALWLDDTRLLLLHRGFDFMVRCTVVQAADGSALPLPAGCPQSSFYGLYDVTSGPSDRMVVYSAGEGHPGVDFLTWTPQAQAPLGVPTFDLYPFGPLHAGFDAQGTLFLQTPCDLSRERGCPDDGPGPPVERVYRWTPDKGLQVVLEDLPPGVRFDPRTKRLAWVQDSKVCVTDKVGAEARCVALPAESAPQ